MATLKLRDRDAITTKEGLIFRVFGYSHPSMAYICDTEYASSKIFKSDNPKALRNRGQEVFYKFYEDEGFKFLKKAYPKYLILLESLGKKVVGVGHSDVFAVKKPDVRLEDLLKTDAHDNLIESLNEALEHVLKHSSLSAKDFGVFGSILHDFYHPHFSDLDFVIYGRGKIAKLCETLKELHASNGSLLKNEFESDKSIKGKNWRFYNYSAKEYVWHQRRKLIYSLFNSEKAGRVIKTEFEPVKDWKEICEGYDSNMRILQKGWVKMLARITEDDDSPFIPSIYRITSLDVLQGARDASEVTRIVSYVEEYRMQAWKDEKVYVEGNLEEVATPKGSFYQIALTYCPRYYEQAFKVVS